MSATDRTATIDTISRTGVAVRATAIDSSNGDLFTNDGVTCIEITKGAGTAVTGSISYASAYDGQTVPPKAMSVGASASKQFGPFPVPMFGSTITIVWTGDTTNTTIHLFRVGSS